MVTSWDKVLAGFIVQFPRRGNQWDRAQLRKRDTAEAQTSSVYQHWTINKKKPPDAASYSRVLQRKDHDVMGTTAPFLVTQ